MSAFEITNLVGDDIARVRRIDALVYPEPWSRKLWLAELERDRRVYLVARLDGEICGYVGALVAVDDVHILTVAADPRHQRQGIATRLLLAALRRSIALGATALTLEVRVGNAAAQALYRRFGMAPAGVRRGYYEPDGEDALVMWVHDIAGPVYQDRLMDIERHLHEPVSA